MTMQLLDKKHPNVFLEHYLGRNPVLGLLVGVVSLPQVCGPWADSSDVETEIILVGSRRQGEGVVFTFPQGSTSNPDPLPRLIFKVYWTFEL